MILEIKVQLTRWGRIDPPVVWNASTKSASQISWNVKPWMHTASNQMWWLERQQYMWRYKQ
jgi:hypothetical protein